MKIRDTHDGRAAALERMRRNAGAHRQRLAEQQHELVVQELTECVRLGLGWPAIAPRLRSRCGLEPVSVPASTCAQAVNRKG